MALVGGRADIGGHGTPAELRSHSIRLVPHRSPFSGLHPDRRLLSQPEDGRHVLNRK